MDHVTTYGLFLAVDIPASTGIFAKDRCSPLAALASYEVHSWVADTAPSSATNAPGWTHMKPCTPLLFRQPQGAMAEVFAVLAYWVDNNMMVRRQYSLQY
jgi:hypothetical protein